MTGFDNFKEYIEQIQTESTSLDKNKIAQLISDRVTPIIMHKNSKT